MNYSCSSFLLTYINSYYNIQLNKKGVYYANIERRRKDKNSKKW